MIWEIGFHVFKRDITWEQSKTKATRQISKPVGSKQVLMKAIQLGRPKEGASYTTIVLGILGGGNDSKSGQGLLAWH